MNAAERQAMREELARALGTGIVPEGAAEHPGAFPVALREARDGESLEARFRRELEALAGTVHEAGGANAAEAVAAIVCELAQREGGREVLAWDDDQLPVPGVTKAIEARGFRVITQRPADAQDATARQAWAGAAVGLTGAAAALAETGSIVVVSGPGRGRLASLLTPIHVAVVSRRTLRGTLPELLAEQPTLATSGTNMVVITGPSRTADIEHTLSRGVHGPREIHVILVD